MSKPEARAAARRRRAEGAPLRVIAEELGVAKSSVSVWVRDVPVPPEALYWTSGQRVPRRPDAAEPVRGLRVWRSGSTQRCSRCRLLLPHESFNRMGTGRQAYCRPCFGQYYRERRADLLPRWNAVTRERVARSRAFVQEFLTSQACADCGERDTVVLEFDHLGDKLAHVADLAASGRGFEVIAAEIAKCDVVCVNCHRRRTAERAGWARASPDWRRRIARRQKAVRLALELVYDHLERNPCVDCGRAELTVLEFDHLGEKRFSVPRAASLGVSREEIADEIAGCAVRCGNCHRRKTAERGGHHRWTAARPRPDRRVS